jgi:hypothetical protein
MAQYKVPQDVEAEDKLLGPFTFRQFVYLLIAAGLIALIVGLFQLFPLLALLPVFPALLFLVLALPLKKDQPMETYLAAIVSYYLKPRTKRWMPGQRESTILITAPKIVEDVRTRDITGEEATHRLSFLADIVDTQGYAIKGTVNSSMKEDMVAEANATEDMFDSYRAASLLDAIENDTTARHKEAIKEMRNAIDRNEETMSMVKAVGNKELGHGVVLDPGDAVAERLEPIIHPESNLPPLGPEPESEESVIVMPDDSMIMEQKTKQEEAKTTEKEETKPHKRSIIELANNNNYSVETIAKEANKINGKDEVFISLH